MAQSLLAIRTRLLFRTLHTLVGAIATGSVEGALSSGTTAVSIPAVDAYLEKQGVDETTRDALLLGLSAAAGAVIGGDTASTATSFSQTQNNYLTHKQIAEWGKELESCVKNRGNKCTVSVKEAINNKYTKKSEQQQQELKSACGTNGNAQKCDTLRNKYYNVEGIPYDKQADKYAPKIISYGYGSKANSKLAVIQTMHNVEAEGIFAQQTANQERAKGRSGKAFAMEMAPVIAGSVIAGKMGSSRGTIKPPTNEKGTSSNKNLADLKNSNLVLPKDNPGTAQSRVNVAKKTQDGKAERGFDYAIGRHGVNSTVPRKSRYSISDNEVKSLLQESKIVKSPVYNQVGRDGKVDTEKFIRQVDTGRAIGKTQDGKSTSVITIITNRKGELINTFPGTL